MTDDRKRIEEIREYRDRFLTRFSPDVITGYLEFLLAQIDKRDEALRDTARLVRTGIAAGHNEDEALKLIEGALTYNPLIDCHKLKQYFQDSLAPFLKRAREALGEE